MLKLYKLIIIVILFSSCEPGWESSESPIHLNPNMDLQERYNYQEESKFFKDKRTVRSPVEGTVARKYDDAHQFIKYDDINQEFENAKKNDSLIRDIPKKAYQAFSSKLAMVTQGKKQFNIYCAPCHNYSGDGKGILYSIGKVQGIANLHNYPPGKAGLIYRAIKYGVNNGNMPSYAVQIESKDRWAIIAYIYELQKKLKDY